MYTTIFFLIFLFIYTILCERSTDNVGTVLFTRTDVSRKCWNAEKINLLTSRMVFEDVLPIKQTAACDNDQALESMIKYFRMVIDTVKSSSARDQEYLLKAASDTLGGYLHHTVIPQGKHSFYSGAVGYDVIQRMYQLYDELKNFLRTDGQTWAPPIIISNKVRRDVAPLSDPKTASADPCASLEYCEKDGQFTIPMPFFDSKYNPKSLALPFKTYPLRNIESKNALYILVKFYNTAIQCLTRKNCRSTDLNRFNQEFESFINTYVLPRLNDQRIYPAFGSVYRILESIKKGTEVPSPYGQFGPNGWNFYDANGNFNPKWIIVISVACVCLLWAILGILFCVCRRRRKHHKKYSEGILSTPRSHHSKKSTSREGSPRRKRKGFPCFRSCNKNRKSRKDLTPRPKHTKHKRKKRSRSRASSKASASKTSKSASDYKKKAKQHKKPKQPKVTRECKQCNKSQCHHVGYGFIQNFKTPFTSKHKADDEEELFNVKNSIKRSCQSLPRHFMNESPPAKQQAVYTAFNDSSSTDFSEEEGESDSSAATRTSSRYN